jgi:hypothetical protein
MPFIENRATTTAPIAMTASVVSPSQPITTDGPRDNARSNR